MNWERMLPEDTVEEPVVQEKARHPLARAGLIIGGGAAALALWAGLNAASAETSPVVDVKKSVVLTQDSGGHGCSEEAPAPANASPSV
jgi:hypothetical protein